jgi:SAM-dependent methyltransferase
MSVENWEQNYLDGRTGWDRGEPSPALRHWQRCGLLTPGSRILIPGCGYGHEVIDLSRLGLNVTALDVARTPIEFLKKRLAEEGLLARCIQADLFEWLPSEPFDLIYDQTCLCALNPDIWSQYASLLKQWLVPGGLLLAHFMQTGRKGGPPFHCSLPDMKRLFREDVWVWSEERQRIGHPAGLEEWLYALTRSE